MKKALLLLLFLAMYMNCTSVKPAVKMDIEDTKIFTYKYDNVWTAVSEVLAERDILIQDSQKEAGVISTRDKVFAYAGAEEEMKKIASIPEIGGVFRSEINQAKYRFDIYVKRLEGQKTEVRIISQMAISNYKGNENLPYRDYWHTCYSNGTVEKALFDEISTKLR